jgi:hypothetical protein
MIVDEMNGGPSGEQSRWIVTGYFDRTNPAYITGSVPISQNKSY